MKNAIVKPLLKKRNLDPNDLNNFRPVSDLICLSKQLERAACTQLTNYFTLNSLLSPYQSAYRKNFSVETSLLYISNSLRKYIDSGYSIIVILLDLSAAFDTVDHSILLSRLEHRFGVVGKALQWIKSYIQNRSFTVKCGTSMSSPRLLPYGVPQGSVLGPVLFTAYTTPLGDVIEKHGLEYMFYADDTQLWLPVNTKDPAHIQSCLKQITLCLTDIFNWMTRNKLKINPSKTELMLITSPFSNTPIPSITVTINDTVITSSTSVRNLGIIFDNNFSLHRQISKTLQTGYIHLRNIRSVSKYLTPSLCETLVHAFISNKIDNCNSLYVNMPKAQLNRLQKLQNCAARLLTKTSRRQHITPTLKSLHWLPVESRIKFKILLLTYKCINHTAPEYLSSTISLRQSTRFTRQSATITLNVPRSKLVTYGDRSFSVAAPILFNSLPPSIRACPTLTQFKASVKTYLFNMHFR